MKKLAIGLGLLLLAMPIFGEEDCTDVQNAVEGIECLESKIDQLQERFNALEESLVVTGESLIAKLDAVHENKTPRPQLLVGSCNSANPGRTLEIFVGPDSDNLRRVASVSGEGRLSATALVPPGWFFRVVVPSGLSKGCGGEAWGV